MFNINKMLSRTDERPCLILTLPWAQYSFESWTQNITNGQPGSHYSQGYCQKKWCWVLLTKKKSGKTSRFFQCRYFTSLVRVILRYFILLGAIVNRIVFSISYLFVHYWYIEMQHILYIILCILEIYWFIDEF